MLSLHSLPASWAPAAAPVHSSARSCSVTMETKADLVALAEQLNPVSLTTICARGGLQA